MAEVMTKNSVLVEFKVIPIGRKAEFYNRVVGMQGAHIHTHTDGFMVTWDTSCPYGNGQVFINLAEKMRNLD